VDANARWGPHGDYFPLQWAIAGNYYEGDRHHRSEIVRLLLSHGADPNAGWCPFESRGYPGGPRSKDSCATDAPDRPLIAATVRDQADTVYRLLDAGADPRLEDWSGQIAIDYARSEVVFQLLAAALFPDSSSRPMSLLGYLRDRAARTGDTPLSNVFTRGLPLPPPPPASTKEARSDDAHAEMVRRLIELGADPNERMTEGETSLMAAAAFRELGVATVLLEHGADASLRDRQGRTALDYVRKDDEPMRTLLLNASRAPSPSASPPASAS
jgi:ankyrin repeat protein